jgi:RimJ/RimL family protein N-acetyltransferase
MHPPQQQPSLVAESIDSADIRLRRFRADDAFAVQAACDDPLIQRYLPGLAHVSADATPWATTGTTAAFATGGANFAITDPATDQLLGGIAITPQADGEGTLGYWVAPSSRRRGVATLATRMLTEEAFSAGYGRITMRTAFENTASQRVAIGAGYRREGIARAATPGPGGNRHDLIVWARVIGDPPGPIRRYLPDLPDGELTDDVVSLRRMKATDATEVHPVRSSPGVVANTVTGRTPTPTETAQYCARAEAAWLEDRGVQLTMRDASTGAFVGKVGLQLESPDTGQAEIDYYVGSAWQGRGYATRAVNMLCQWAFAHTGIVRLVAGAHTTNVASQRVLTRSGFTREGHERARLPNPSGGRDDLYTYARLHTDAPIAR